MIRRREPKGVIYVEGSAAHAKVVSAKGDVVLNEFFDVPFGKKHRVLRTQLPPGTYRIKAYQAPCDPSACQAPPSTWGDPQLPCSTQFTADEGARLVATLTVTPERCRIGVELEGG